MASAFNKNYSEVIDRLFVGGRVHGGFDYSDFDLIVLCARSWQPQLPRFHGSVWRRGFDDMTDSLSVQRAMDIAGAEGYRLSYRWSKGLRCLVTCEMGLNRSALVAAVALSYINPTWSADQIIECLRNARGWYALSNEGFERAFRAWMIEMSDE